MENENNLKINSSSNRFHDLSLVTESSRKIPCEQEKSSPKISCIVPVYNVEKYIHRCIDSILGQTFADFELILIDDGSPDNSGKICDEYAAKDNRIKVIHQENKGVSAARNAGLDAATGKYVCFVDSDDWTEKDYFQSLYDMITKSNYDVAICGFWGEKRQKPKNLKKRQATIKLFSEKGYGGFSPKKILSLELINVTPKSRYDEKMQYLEDSEFFYKVFKKCDSVYWNNIPLYHYETNEWSVTQQKEITMKHFKAYETLEKIIKEETDKAVQNNLKVFYVNFRSISNFLSFMQKENLSELERKEFVLDRKILGKNFFTFIFSPEILFHRKILGAMLFLGNLKPVQKIIKAALEKKEKQKPGRETA